MSITATVFRWICGRTRRLTSVGATPHRSEAADVTYRHARAESGLAHATHLDQPHSAVPVAGVRLQQLQHAVVVDGTTSERPAHQRGQVEVPYRHLVRVASRTLRHLGRGPYADTRHCTQPLQPQRPIERQRLLEPIDRKSVV